MKAGEEKASVRKGWVVCDTNLTGKLVIITGANTGLGLETAKDLAKRNANIIFACRNLEKAEDAKKQISAATQCEDSQLRVKKLDLSSLASIRSFAADVNNTEEKIDILINNAGVMMCPKFQTEDGFETHFGVNHLGHFLLTNLLLDKIKNAAPSRIINLSSFLHGYSRAINWGDLNFNRNYSPREAYQRSKLMNVLFTRALSKRLQGTRVTANSVHPGIVKTEILRHVYDSDEVRRGSVWRNMLWGLMRPIEAVMFKSVAFGAQTQIYCAVAPELENVSGKYFSDCAIKQESSRARNDADAEQLWQVSEKLTGLTS